MTARKGTGSDPAHSDTGDPGSENNPHITQPGPGADGVALKITRLPEVAKGTKAPTKTYWIGTVPGAPLHNIALGGVSFPRCLGQPDRHGVNQGLAGHLAQLSDAQRDHVLAEVARRVVRVRGKSVRVLEAVLPKGEKSSPIYVHRYRWDADDVPLGCYLYMHLCREGMGHNMRPSDRPTPLCEQTERVQRDLVESIESAKLPRDRTHITHIGSGR